MKGFEKKVEDIETFADMFPNQTEEIEIARRRTAAQLIEKDAAILVNVQENWKNKSLSLKKRTDGKFDERSSDGRFMNRDFPALQKKVKNAQKDAKKAQQQVPKLAVIYQDRRAKLVKHLAPPFFLKTVFLIGILSPVRPTWAMFTAISVVYYAIFSGLWRKSFVKSELAHLERELEIDPKLGSRN